MQLNKIKLELNNSKTCIRSFSVGAEGLTADKPLQYLGLLLKASKR